jgi:hypothetical protein
MYPPPEKVNVCKRGSTQNFLSPALVRDRDEAPENHCWRNGDWKVIYEYLNSGPQRYYLFNLKNDISESNNLAGKHPDKLRKMMTEMVDELTKMKALYPVKGGKVLKPVIPGA